MKHLCFRMKQHQSGSNFKELFKVNYQASLSVSGLFPFGTAAIKTILKEDRKTWKDYIKINDEDHEQEEKEITSP